MKVLNKELKVFKDKPHELTTDSLTKVVYTSVATCEIFHVWLISATGSVATEHPQPTTASFVGSDLIPSKNVSRDLLRWHYNSVILV